jgi:hypothetical protein
MKSVFQACTLFTLILILSACNLGTAAPQSPAVVSTSAAQTVEALLTPAAALTATQSVSTDVPAITPTPTAACEDTATNTAWTRDNILYDVKAVNTPLAPNKTFIMSWTFLNTGTCTWNNVYQMYFESGTSMTHSVNFPMLDFGKTVAPGQTVTVNIEMTAPDKDGEYQSVWRFQNDRGVALMNFGVTIKVGSASSLTLKAPKDLKYTYDCTTGVVNINLLWGDVANDEDGYRIYRDGAKLADVPAGSTTYTDIAPGVGEYDYTVSAFNSSGESPTEVHVSTKNCQ